jgi:hypothetical protein
MTAWLQAPGLWHLSRLGACSSPRKSYKIKNVFCISYRLICGSSSYEGRFFLDKNRLLRVLWEAEPVAQLDAAARRVGWLLRCAKVTDQSKIGTSDVCSPYRALRLSRDPSAFASVPLFLLWCELESWCEIKLSSKVILGAKEDLVCKGRGGLRWWTRVCFDGYTGCDKQFI